MTTIDLVIEKLRGTGVISGKHPTPKEEFTEVCRYLTQMQLQEVITLTHGDLRKNYPKRFMYDNFTGNSYFYTDDFRVAADIELSERNLLGKQRLDYPRG